MRNDIQAAPELLDKAAFYGRKEKLEISRTKQVEVIARVLILGASNVVRCFPAVLDTARTCLGAPVDVMAAIGHGRSYGMTTNVMGRRLPSILECDLWKEWAARDACPTYSLITDVGNDILYGGSAQQIAQWVEMCLEKVAKHSERLIVTELPLASTSQLTPRRFLMLRSVLFPHSRITYQEALDKAVEVNERLVQLAAKYQAATVRPPGEWYGIDPIHILPIRQRSAWDTILASWKGDEPRQLLVRASKIQLLLARPKYREVFGIRQRRAQPSLRMKDGTRISLY